MSVFNINGFMGAMREGGARPNQFRVQLNFPAVAQNAIASMQSEFLVIASSLPGLESPPTVTSYRGRAVKFYGDMVFNPWSTTLVNDTNFTMRNAIEEWMRGIEDFQNKFGAVDYTQYMADLHVQQLDKNGSILKTYTLYGAFPVATSPVNLAFDSNNQISTTDVTWEYQNFDARPAGFTL